MKCAMEMDACGNNRQELITGLSNDAEIEFEHRLNDVIGDFVVLGY